MRCLALSLALLLAAPAALAQDRPVRDCRGDGAVTLPAVPRGVDAIPVHAADDLLGPSIFDREAEMPDGSALEIAVRAFPDYAAQLDAYLACETPFLRVTHAMMSTLAEVTEADPRTEMRPVFFYGWSNGADVLVGRDATSVAEISGARLLTDAARLGFALQLAADAPEAPEVAVVDDPAAAFAADDTARFAVADQRAAEVLTAGDVGTGAEGSVAGAREVLSTASASRVVGEVIAVRADYLEANRDTVRATVRALLKAEELFREDVKKQVVDWELAAETLLGDAARVDELREMWGGMETVGLAGQVSWADATAPRSYRALINESQSRMVAAGLIPAAIPLADPELDYAALGDDIWDKRRTTTESFDTDAARQAIDAMTNEEIEGSTISSVTILFEPNQATFPVEQYGDAFAEALEKAQVYAGAVLSIEAHSSYLGYLRGVLQEDWSRPRQKRELASLRNISTARAMAVRDALLETANDQGIPIDESQITIDGRGIEDPLGGFCDDLPCPPKTEQEWNESRRVVFRVIRMEAEEEVFTPLNEW
jgi:hypothetical protein